MADDKPQRIQLSRKKGWKKPPNTVVVARPSGWGNPHRIGWCDRCGVEHTREEAIAEYEAELDEVSLVLLEQLRGKNLACWCKPGEPCHGDILLRLANS